MKKLLLVLMSVFFTLTACVEEISHPEVNYPEIHATIQNSQTKTVMDEHNNIRWSTGDQVVAFMKSSLGLKYQIKDAYVGKTSGYFSKVMTTPADEIGAGTALDHNIAYYPYSETVVVEKSLNIYRLDVVLPDEQTYTAESFGNNSFPMVAVSEDNDFTFKNVGGGIKFIPLTGVTLPFVSYGGSSVMTTMIMFFIVQALSMKESKKEGEKHIVEKNTKASKEKPSQ